MLNHIVLDRLQKTGWLRNRSSPGGQIYPHSIIFEQSIELSTLVYVIFIDFDKAFDSVDHETLWKLLAHYGFPQKFISIIKSTK